MRLWLRLKGKILHKEKVMLIKYQGVYTTVSHWTSCLSQFSGYSQGLIIDLFGKLKIRGHT